MKFRSLLKVCGDKEGEQVNLHLERCESKLVASTLTVDSLWCTGARVTPLTLVLV